MNSRTEYFISGNLRKFLFWFRYDGSRFASMAKGGDPFKGPSIIQLVITCLDKVFGREHSDRIKTFIVSRTDAKVHAIRSPILVGLPKGCEWFDQSELTRRNFLDYFNDQIQNAGYAGAVELLRIHPVALGFHPSYHVAYRRYVYRLRVLSPEQSRNYPDRFFTQACHLIPNKTSLDDIAEYHYSWTIPPTFSVERAQIACDLLMKPGQNFASFYFHQLRLRKMDKQYKSVTRRRQLSLLQIEKGEPYHFADDEAQFYNLNFIAHGFMRQQIRRMVSLIVNIACDTSGSDPRRIYEFLLRDPDPVRFHEARLVPAPSSGLFLTDVVYDPKMFTKPMPEYLSAWDLDDCEEQVVSECADDEPLEGENTKREEENGESENELDKKYALESL